MDLNHNISSCIKETANWGEHIYTNVCTGAAVTIVPWGIAEYGAVIFGTGLMLAVMMARMLK